MVKAASAFAYTAVSAAFNLDIEGRQASIGRFLIADTYRNGSHGNGIFQREMKVGEFRH
ncbi:MAG: hypothetical protein U0176_17250 [Bacteroidia bacterium]